MHINLSGQLDNKTEISPLKSNIDCHMSNETNDMFSTALFLGINVRFVGWKKRSLFIITTSNTQTIVDTTQRTKNPSKMTKIHWPQASSWSPPPPLQIWVAFTCCNAPPAKTPKQGQPNGVPRNEKTDGFGELCFRETGLGFGAGRKPWGFYWSHGNILEM